jgi:hypothetical protein
VVLQHGTGYNYDIYISDDKGTCNSYCSPSEGRSDYNLTTRQLQKEIRLQKTAPSTELTITMYFAFKLRGDRSTCNLDALILLENLPGYQGKRFLL